MEIKVKYNNGKLFSNNKDIILNNVADIHEIVQNEPCALSTKVFFGIIKDVDGKKRIFLIVPVRSLVDDDVNSTNFEFEDEPIPTDDELIKVSKILVEYF